MYIHPPDDEQRYSTLPEFLVGCKPAIVRTVELSKDKSIFLVELDLEKMDLPDCYYDETDYQAVYTHDHEEQELYVVVYRKRENNNGDTPTV